MRDWVQMAGFSFGIVARLRVFDYKMDTRNSEILTKMSGSEPVYRGERKRGLDKDLKCGDYGACCIICESKRNIHEAARMIPISFYNIEV